MFIRGQNKKQKALRTNDEGRKMTDIVVDMELDCSGLLCPLPILKMAKAIKQLEKGQVLKMIATDAGAPADVEAWTLQTKHELLASEQDNGRYIFLVRRTR